MGRKINPRRRPATQADIIRAKNAATSEAASSTSIILMTVLWDKEHYTPEDMQRVWREVEDLSDSIIKGYCNIADLRNVLKKEAGIVIE